MQWQSFYNVSRQTTTGKNEIGVQTMSKLISYNGRNDSLSYSYQINNVNIELYNNFECTTKYLYYYISKLFKQ